MFMWWLFTMLLASFRVASLISFGSVPELWGFVLLCPFVFMDSFFFLAGSQARWPYPQNHFYLCLLVVRSIAMPQYLPHALSCLPYSHVQPLTHLVLANRCLAMLPLCSAPLIALLVAGEDGVCSMLEHGFVGISLLYLVYFNAPIYLVKGGRLGLMPGVLFHSCRPSFRHTGVMFLDFAFLTRLGVVGTPWQFALNKTPPARPNLGFTICLSPTSFSQASASLSVGPNRVDCGVTSGKLEVWFYS